MRIRCIVRRWLISSVSIRLVFRIDPGPGNHCGAIARSDAMLVGIDQFVERRRVDQTLIDQQFFQIGDTLLDLGERLVVDVAVGVFAAQGSTLKILD